MLRLRGGVKGTLPRRTLVIERAYLGDRLKGHQGAAQAINRQPKESPGAGSTGAVENIAPRYFGKLRENLSALEKLRGFLRFGSVDRPAKKKAPEFPTGLSAGKASMPCQGYCACLDR